MASDAPETATHLPTVHEYGQRALRDGPAAGPSAATAAAGPSQAAPVSPATTDATPAARSVQPVSPVHQAAQPAAQPSAQADATAAYAAHAPQAPVYPADAPTAIYSWKRRHMLLLLLAFVLSVIALGLAAYTAAEGFYEPGAILCAAMPAYIVTIILAIAETAVRASFKFKQGFHPAVHVATWVFCWLIYLALIITYGVLMSSGWDYEDNGSYAIAHFVFIILLFLNTIGLFIVGCMDCQAYNIERSAPPPVTATGNVNPDHHADRSWGLTKLVFNAIVIVFGIVGFALGLSMLKFGDAWLGDNIIFPACACALLLPVIWAIADLCYSLTGPRRPFFRGITPAAHVGLWLVSWIVIAIIGGILTTYAAIRVSDCSNYSDGYLRRSVPVNGDMHRHVPVVASSIVPIEARQINTAPTPVPTQSSTIPGVASLPTLTRTVTSLPKVTPTTTSRLFGSDPYDPDYDPDYPYDDPDYDPDYPYDDPDYDPYYDPYSRYYTSTTRTTSSYGSRSTSGYGYYNDPDDDYPHNHNYYSDDYDAAIRAVCTQQSYKGVMIATCVCLWIVFVFAFALFVAGCSDTHLRNRQRSLAFVTYVPMVPSMYAASGPVGYTVGTGKQPMQMQQMQPMQMQQMQPMQMQQMQQMQPMMQPMQQAQFPQGQVPQAQAQQVQQAHPRGNVVEYYGTAQ